MKTFAIACLLVLTFSAYSQERKSGYALRMTHGIGGSYQEFNGLNERMSAFPQYDALKNYYGTLNLGWSKEVKRFIHTLDLTAGSTMTGKRNRRSSTVRFLGVSTDIGYDVIKNDRVMLYPLAGVGFEKYQALFFKDNSGVDFNAVAGSTAVQESIGPVDFKNNFFNYRFGIGAQFSSKMFPAHSIGLQAGYTGSFTNRAWKSNYYQQLANAPQDDISRFYVTLLFGFSPTKWKHRGSM